MQLLITQLSGLLPSNRERIHSKPDKSPRTTRRDPALLAAATAAAAALMSASYVQATTISLAGYTTASIVPVTVGTTLGASAYEFFATSSGNKSSSSLGFVSYIGTPSGIADTGGGGTSLKIAGTTYTSGLYYQGGGSYGVYNSIDVVSLSTSSVPSEFQLGIYADNLTPDAANTGSGGNATDFEVVDHPTLGSNTTSAPTTDVAAGTGSVNDFYFLDIYNALPGDTLTIYADHIDSNGGNQEIGGVTFDDLSAPEPTSLGLMAVASVVSLTRRRRRPPGPRATTG